MREQASPVREQADGSAVCRHRDLGVCSRCAEHPWYVEVYGAHYWLPDAADRRSIIMEIELGE